MEKTLQIHMKELREQIAKEIEAKANETYYDEKEIWLEAATIARRNNG